MRKHQDGVEPWFFMRGLTSMLADTPARTETSVRAVPLLVGIYLLTMIYLVPSATEGNKRIAITALLSLVIILVTWVGANLARRRRPFQAPARVGWPEALVFILGPTLTLLIAPHGTFEIEHLQFSSLELRLEATTGIFLWQLSALVVILGLVKSGLISIFVHLSREAFASIASTGLTLTRTLPLLLGVVSFFFFTNEIWQAIPSLSLFPFLGVIALFVVLMLAFLSSRQELDVAALAHFESERELREALLHTPAAGVPIAVALPANCPLTRRQRASLRLTATMSRLVVTSIVVLAVFIFFMIFGLLLVNPEMTKLWTGREPEILLAWKSSIRTYAVTLSLVKVSIFLAVFSGFYFSVVSATDPAMRQGVRDSVTDTLREACALRLAVLSGFTAPAAGPGSEPAAAPSTAAAPNGGPPPKKAGGPPKGEPPEKV